MLALSLSAGGGSIQGTVIDAADASLMKFFSLTEGLRLNFDPGNDGIVTGAGKRAAGMVSALSFR